jgi:hypothetical protein
MDFTTIPPGCLTEGTETPKGVIEAVSLTAYMIEGRWYPFAAIHGRPKPVTPLAVAAGLLEAVEPFRAEMNEANRRNIEAMLNRGGK